MTAYTDNLLPWLLARSGVDPCAGRWTLCWYCFQDVPDPCDCETAAEFCSRNTPAVRIEPWPAIGSTIPGGVDIILGDGEEVVTLSRPDPVAVLLVDTLWDGSDDLIPVYRECLQQEDALAMTDKLSHLLAPARFRAWLETKPADAFVGTQGNPCFCPIAQYLSEAGAERVLVLPHSSGKWGSVRTAAERAGLPPALNRFAVSADRLSGPIYAALALDLLARAEAAE